MKTQDTLFTAKTIDEQIDDLSQSEDEQLLSSSLNARIVHDLYLVYDHASYSQHVESSLERIWQHLEVHGVQGERVGAGEQGTRQSKIIPEQTKGYWKLNFPFSSRRMFVSRLGSLAAVLFIALLVGSLVLTLLATRNHENNLGGSSAFETVIIHMGQATFRPSSVTIRPGMILRLVNDTDVEHVIENGYWKDDGTPIHLQEPDMPKVHLVLTADQQSGWIGPFNKAGTYYLVDTVHVGMTLTIMVE